MVPWGLVLVLVDAFASALCGRVLAPLLMLRAVIVVNSVNGEGLGRIRRSRFGFEFLGERFPLLLALPLLLGLAATVTVFLRFATAAASTVDLLVELGNGLVLILDLCFQCQKGIFRRALCGILES